MEGLEELTRSMTVHKKIFKDAYNNKNIQVKHWDLKLIATINEYEELIDTVVNFNDDEGEFNTDN